MPRYRQSWMQLKQDDIPQMAEWKNNHSKPINWSFYNNSGNARLSYPLYTWLNYPKFGKDSAGCSAIRPPLSPLSNIEIQKNSQLPSFSDNGKVSTNFSGMGYSYYGMDEMLDSGVIQGPECALETDYLLNLFSSIGTPEFLDKSKKIASSPSSSQVTRFNLQVSGAGNVTATATEPRCTCITSITQKEGQFSNWKQSHKRSIYDLIPCQPQAREAKQLCLKPKGLSLGNVNYSNTTRLKQTNQDKHSQFM